MTLDEKIEVLGKLGDHFKNGSQRLDEIKIKAKNHNAWFTDGFIDLALNNIVDHYLDRQKLKNWTAKYKMHSQIGGKKVGLILAGNIPVVGIHDIISVFLSDHIALIKLSSKDDVLSKYIIEQLVLIDKRVGEYLKTIDRLDGHEAVIATGSNNSSRYFKSYFGQLPHIIRKNRNGVAIVNKNISDDDLLSLGEDVFTYFGLGCRNVSKLYLEEGFEVSRIIELWKPVYQSMMDHTKYKNNFDYNYALYLLNKDEFYSDGYLIFKKDEMIASRIACLHYELFSDQSRLNEVLISKKDEIQCLIAEKPIEGFNHFSFGESQIPSLKNYADGVDTIQFLMML